MEPGFDFDSYWKAWIAIRLNAIRQVIDANKEAQRMEEARQQQPGNPAIPESSQDLFEDAEYY